MRLEILLEELDGLPLRLLVVDRLRKERSEWVSMTYRAYFVWICISDLIFQHMILTRRQRMIGCRRCVYDYARHRQPKESTDGGETSFHGSRISGKAFRFRLFLSEFEDTLLMHSQFLGVQRCVRQRSISIQHEDQRMCRLSLIMRQW